MDLVPAPSGEPPVKSPVVEVEAVDVAEQVSADAVALEEASSESESDSDDSEGWETLSAGDDMIQFVRDEQLRDGLGMSLLGCLALLPRTPPLSESTFLPRANLAGTLQSRMPVPWKKRSHIASVCMT